MLTTKLILGRGNTGDLGLVQGRENLDDICGYNIEAGESLDDKLDNFTRRPAARGRTGSARRKGRVENLHVEGRYTGLSCGTAFLMPSMKPWMPFYFSIYAAGTMVKPIFASSSMSASESSVLRIQAWTDESARRSSILGSALGKTWPWASCCPGKYRLRLWRGGLWFSEVNYIDDLLGFSTVIIPIFDQIHQISAEAANSVENVSCTMKIPQDLTR